jgi:hypothetical protein
MLFAEGGLALVFFAVWVFCIIDVITTPEGAARNLPKMAWLFIVILLSDVGSIAWLIAGRPWNAQTAAMPYKGNRGKQQTAPLRVNGTNPDDDEEFLARLRERAEEQRRRARDAKQGEERSGDDTPSV